MIIRIGIAVFIFLTILGVGACSSEMDETSPSQTPEDDRSTAATAPESEIEGTATQSTEAEPTEQMYPDILDADLELQDDGTYDVSVTVSSPYDTQERYADAWRLLTPDGEEIAVRILTHPHANEQPFTRSLTGVQIPKGLETVVVQGRDKVNGWGGETIEVAIPGS